MANLAPDVQDGSANRLPVGWQEISTSTGTIVVDNRFVLLSYAGATAVTLPASTGLAGTPMTIMSNVAQAHVVTGTDLINGDNDTLTWASAVANNCTIYADGSGEWLTGNLTGVTVG